MAAKDVIVEYLAGPDPRARYRVTRPMVEAQDVTSLAEALEILIQSPHAVRAWRGRVSLVFDGYDDDPRDLWLIPEVRTFVQAVDRAFPYLFWFVDISSGSLLVLAACCCEPALSEASGGKTAVVLPPAFVNEFLHTHLDAAKFLRERHRLDEAELDDVIGPIFDFFKVPWEKPPARSPKRIPPGDGPVRPIPPATGPATGVRIDEAFDRALRMIASGIAGLLASSPEWAGFSCPPDMMALRDPRWRTLAVLLHRLATTLVDEAVKQAPQSEFEQVASELAAALNALPLEQHDVMPYADAAFAHTANLMEEIALERHAALLDVRDMQGGTAAVIRRMSTGTAEAQLLPRVCGHVFAWGAADPLGIAELKAAQWQFRRWSGPYEAGGEAAAAARLTRQLEYLVLDLHSIAFDATLIEAFLPRTRKNDPSPRQRELMRLLPDSVSGIFAVRRRRGEVTVLENVERGGELEFVEYNDRLGYQALDYALGRLFRLPSGRYMRSPAMVFWRPSDAGASRELVEYHEQFRRRFPGIDAALVLEATIQTSSGGRNIPEDLDPPSPAEAQALLSDVRARLAVSGRDRAAALVPERPLPEDGSDPAMAEMLKELGFILTLWLADLSRAAFGGAE